MKADKSLVWGMPVLIGNPQAPLNKAIHYLLEQMKCHDFYTYHHSLRVGTLSEQFARILHLPKDEQQLIKTMGLMHDIGKLKIPVSIIQKNTSLTNEEYRMIQNHTIYGVEILKNFTLSIHPAILDGILYHHENIDGTGYTEGMKDNEIPYYARMLRIVDSFDAMITRRPYCGPLNIDTALSILTEEQGRSFDPTLSTAFCQSVRKKKFGLLNAML